MEKKEELQQDAPSEKEDAVDKQLEELEKRVAEFEKINEKKKKVEELQRKLDEMITADTQIKTPTKPVSINPSEYAQSVVEEAENFEMTQGFGSKCNMSEPSLEARMRIDFCTLTKQANKSREEAFEILGEWYADAIKNKFMR